ncbi:MULTISPECIES: UbiX family flavin prenyltransferase [Paenibacillus]|uniref:Flavoprotein domain-containing protein n=1 Tax=Paenibacillus borealis TaxID=160799 RepID=A0ABX3H3S7_PAEBO|nr:UbiX family flavin prenyltransferase [Paenibacillus borealis]OMD45071.1 hypothetical protein BSK56_20995 [Paenibacillus borealis]
MCDKKIIVAVTGASGALYALHLIEQLKKRSCRVYVIMSQAAVITMKHEVADRRYIRQVLFAADGFFDNDNIGASPASGSFHYDALVVVPCSVNTIGMIHSNLAHNLIARTAAVARKERRQVILVPRETPVSAGTLKQLYELCLEGLDVCFAAPAFYSKPQSLDDIIDFMVFKIMNLLKIDNDLSPEWNSGCLHETEHSS